MKVGTIRILAIAAAVCSMAVATPSWAVDDASGVVDKIQVYKDGRIRFHLNGVSNFCTDKDGDPQGWFEIRSSNSRHDASIERITSAVMTSYLAEKSLRVYVNDKDDSSQHYRIGCKAYKVQLE